MQPPGGDPALDLAGAAPELQELAARDRSVLSPHQGPDRRIASVLVPRVVS